MAHKIEQWASDILARGTISGNLLKLPGQLDRADYTKVNKVIEGLGGKWSRKLGGHEFPFDPAELLTSALDAGQFTSRKQDLQFFETPAEIVALMIGRAAIGRGDVVLEPSAGHGRIAAAMIAAGAAVTAVEIDAHNVTVLASYGIAATQADFLDWAPGCADRYDAIVMNPPFTKGQDMLHILAAWDLLKSSGRLVAICGEGAFMRSDKARTSFRDWLNDRDFEDEELESGTFRESGTNVATRMIFGIKTER